MFRDCWKVSMLETKGKGVREGEREREREREKKGAWRLGLRRVPRNRTSKVIAKRGSEGKWATLL